MLTKGSSEQRNALPFRTGFACNVGVGRKEQEMLDAIAVLNNNGAEEHAPTAPR